ncbi:MAG: hypothetical protein LBH01_10360 [Verrucomicrobiales bacterium]|jgi:hypothetical protein|nr:hypothetical protein [Verrucomicrobiales bacterium]
MPKIIIGVGIANYPVHSAGNTWAFLNWALGFRACGWDVWIVENLKAEKLKDANGNPASFAQSANLAHWRKMTNEFGFADRQTLLVDGQSPDRDKLLDFAANADLFLNLSGLFRDQEILGRVKCRIYADLDPAFTQIWQEIYNVDMGLDNHDVFFTVGPLINSPQCRAPKLNREWLPTQWPVNLEYWPFQGASKSPYFTTVTHWYAYGSVEYQGEWYDNKAIEFERLIDLPQHTSAKLEIAGDLPTEHEDYKRYSDKGWHLSMAAEISESWQSYRQFVANSKGEFSPAKNGYIRSRCGWFSDRSSCYLALGCPVVLQETGWSQILPAGEGLLAFSDVDSAALALEIILTDEAKHRRAARKIAEEYLDAKKVVQRMLDKI